MSKKAEDLDEQVGMVEKAFQIIDQKLVVLQTEFSRSSYFLASTVVMLCALVSFSFFVPLVNQLSFGATNRTLIPLFCWGFASGGLFFVAVGFFFCGLKKSEERLNEVETKDVLSSEHRQENSECEREDSN